MATSLLREIMSHDDMKKCSARGIKNGRPGLPGDIVAAVEGKSLNF